MLKTHLKICNLIGLLLISHLLCAQDFQELDKVKHLCHYTYNYQVDSSSISLRKITDMCLYIGSNYTKFEHSSAYLKDSLKTAYQNLSHTEGAIKAMSQISGNSRTFYTFYSVVKKRNSNSITLYETISKIPYMYEEAIDFKWQLVTNCDSMILGYKCNKATTNYAGRSYEAWYCSELPMSEGPYKFGGLPGLIITIKDSQNHHCFELSSIESIDYIKPIWHKNKDYKKIDNEEYIKAKEADINRLIGEMSSRLNASPERLGHLEAKLRARNNYIERF